MKSNSAVHTQLKSASILTLCAITVPGLRCKCIGNDRAYCNAKIALLNNYVFNKCYIGYIDSNFRSTFVSKGCIGIIIEATFYCNFSELVSCVQRW